MVSTGVTAFDKTLEKTLGWLDSLDVIVGWDDRERAYLALRAVLHVLRDRLLPTEAADLGAQLPTLVRGIFFEGWRPAGKPLKYRDREEFLARVAEQAPWLLEADIERTVTAVFEVLSSHVADGETRQLRHVLPPQIRELWARPGL